MFEVEAGKSEKNLQPWLILLDQDAGTKLQRHIGTKKERNKETRAQRDKAEKPFYCISLSLCALVSLSSSCRGIFGFRQSEGEGASLAGVLVTVMSP